MRGRDVFAAVRGLVGAALGAYLAVGLWGGVLAFLRKYQIETSLVILGPLLFCPAAYLGYWYLRGLRRRRFAYAVTWGCAFWALLLAAEPETLPGWLGAGLLGGLAVFLSRRFFQESFLRYVDPVWYRDPRRIAARYGRGRLSGHWHISPPFGPEVPAAFDVGSGGTILHVQGDSIRVELPFRKGGTFSARDVAGVIQAPGIGHCVPYNARGEALAVFCLSGKNGELFAKYLRSRGVLFRRLSEVPLKGLLVPAPLGEAAEYTAKPEEAEPEEEIRHTDFSRYVSREAQDFSLELRRTRPIGAWIGAGMALAIAVFPIGFPIAALLGERAIIPGLKIMLALVLVLIAGPWVLALATGELFPGRLSVENGRIWLDKGLRPIREIPWEDLGGLRYDRAGECYILYDKQEKTLAKFSTRDAFGSQFLNLLTDHDIRIQK